MCSLLFLNVENNNYFLFVKLKRLTKCHIFNLNIELFDIERDGMKQNINNIIYII